MTDLTSFATGQILTLLNIPSPTGFTQEVTEYLMSTLGAMGFSPEKTPKGTVICDLGGEGNPLLLSAHVDTLGAMVRAIKANGRLRYTQIGGYTDNSIENENCVVYTRDGKQYTGTVQFHHASRHVYGDTSGEKRGNDTLEIVLDEVVRTQEDVKALGIAPGDFIAWDARTLQTPSGFIKSRHLDDKASSGVLLALAQGIHEGQIKLSRKTTIMFTVYEETGHGGCGQLPPGLHDFIAVDMGCVGDDLSCQETQVSICCKDSAGPFDYVLTNCLVKLAQEQHIDYATDIYPSYSSDAAAALKAGMEARFALIGPGVFASHGYERTHIKAIENTLKLLAAYIQF